MCIKGACPYLWWLATTDRGSSLSVSLSPSCASASPRLQVVHNMPSPMAGLRLASFVAAHTEMRFLRGGGESASI
ncbi:MAG: hypothetical protein PUE80_01825 [bacterium]|nr:hypothetical protein [bacterium]